MQTIKELNKENQELYNKLYDLIKENKQKEFNKLLLLFIDNEIKQEQLCNK